jgi:Rhodopirellula transposase DDE domain
VEAGELGPGGVAVVARAAGVAADTVRRGRVEAQGLDSASVVRSRRPGGGRKRAEAHDGALVAALEALIDPATRGDPMSALRWTSKSTRALARALTDQGHPVSGFVVRRLLKELGYSLQANAKTTEGGQHPDRDAQFGYLNDTVRAHMVAGNPVISVDTKKKELVGQYKNGGREWSPAGEPTQVKVHDFPDPAVGKANPYGVYDVAADTGWVSVGTDHDTAQFAVATIARWWTTIGAAGYPGATGLLICADGGGSNGYRTRMWKTELADLAARTGLCITVAHLPPGTSKWNKIEHRLFSHISMNWRGRPLTSHEVIVETIAATTTRSGLLVHAELDTAIYPTGVTIPATKITDLEASGILTRATFHGEWNYSLNPPKPDTADTPDTS